MSNVQNLIEEFYLYCRLNKIDVREVFAAFIQGWTPSNDSEQVLTCDEIIEVLRSARQNRFNVGSDAQLCFLK